VKPPSSCQGTVKLADFGASKKIEDLATVGSVGTVETRSIKGTPYWMAPEVRTRGTAEEKEDVFTLIDWPKMKRRRRGRKLIWSFSLRFVLAPHSSFLLARGPFWSCPHHPFNL
jgi:serine/threonine protein kinase